MSGRRGDFPPGCVPGLSGASARGAARRALDKLALLEYALRFAIQRHRALRCRSHYRPESELHKGYVVSRWGERAPSERTHSRGFGRAIDYGKEIALDQARIAHLSSEACIRASRELLPETPFRGFDAWSVYHLITYKPDGLELRAAVFGLTLSDIRAWAYFCYSQDDALWAVLGKRQLDDFTHGQNVDACFGHDVFEVLTEGNRRFALSKAKASLARHRRNAEKRNAR
jgi:hypothetical protein